MINLFDFSTAKWISGKGRSAKWDKIDYPKYLGPEYLMDEAIYRQNETDLRRLKIIFKDISTAVHHRTMLCTVIPQFPAVNDAPTLTVDSDKKTMILQMILGSFALDYVARYKIGYLHLNYFIIEEFALPYPDQIPENIKQILFKFSFRLCGTHEIFSHTWLKNQKIINRHWKSLWAITLHERLRIRCNLDALIAELYGLSWDDFAWILRDCAHPLSHINQIYHTLDPKGFWRVDKDKDPELRHTVLALKAFADLKAMGIDAFCALNDGEGWMIPETLTYAVNSDGTIAFDTLDGKTVPVQERLGERFLDWQLAGTPEESWRECEMHARNILGDEEFEKMMAEIESGGGYRNGEERIGVAERVIGGKGATAVPGVAEVMKKAEKKKKEMEENGKGQRKIGEW
jgi:hypothetical protein